MTTFLKDKAGEMTEYDDKLAYQLAERVEALGNKIILAFKSGLEIENSRL